MSKLHDPSLPPGAIIKEFEDGGALRNDGGKLRHANQNPWYVLATIWGEQPPGINYLNRDQVLAQKTATLGTLGPKMN